MTKTLLVLENEEYNNAVLEYLKRNIGKRRVCYVTLNKTTLGLKEALRQKGIDIRQFYFVDSVTPRLFKNMVPDQCVFLDHPDHPDAAADIILTVARMDRSDLLVLDSLSTLLAYENDRTLIEFLKYFVAFTERLHIDLVMFALKDDRDKPAIKQAMMLVDETRKVR